MIGVGDWKYIISNDFLDCFDEKFYDAKVIQGKVKDNNDRNKMELMKIVKKFSRRLKLILMKNIKNQ